jgi:hypothetical protein
MKKRTMATLICSLVLITTACGSPMKNPDIKQNPAPKKRYEITITIKDAPGPFDSMRTLAQYDIENDRCVPLTPGSGATIAPDKEVDVALTHVGGNVYRGEVYTDLLQDADYYGLGVCHWKLTGVSMYLQHKKLTMPPTIWHDNIVAQKSETTYFSGLSYSQADTERVDTGVPDPSAMHKSDAVFSVTFESKEHIQ